MKLTAGEADGAGAVPAPALRFERASFRYPGAEHDALSGVDLDLYPGEVLALVGGNGSGKSTLARLCNGLHLPTLGRVLVAAGRDSSPSGISEELCTDDESHLWQIRSRVGLLFQDPDDQIVGATVEDDIAFGLENLGVERAEMVRRVSTLLDVVGLAREKDTATHLLSGGQKQRLALAGVLVLHPSVLVLDEPTSMLDPVGRAEILGFVRRLADEGVAVLLITQHMEEAVAADRLAALDGGHLVYVGSPREFFNSDVHARLPLGDPPALVLARELEAALGPACGGVWAGGTGPLDEVDLLAALKESICTAAPAVSVSNGSPADGEGGLEDVFPAAEVRGVDVLYNAGTSFQRRALHGVSLTLPAGTVTAVVGATASGKTTLLQLLAGLVPAARGQIEVFGRPEPRPGDVGMVMQRAEVQLFCATVREDVAVAPRLSGLEGRALDLRVRGALQSVGLDPDDFGERSPHALSLGEQRRVALAGILSLAPRLLILDEPGAGLDPLMRGRLMQDLLLWREDGGRTLLFASHDLEDVARVADYVVLLASGSIVAQGTARDVLGDHAAMLAAGMGLPLAARMAASLSGADDGADDGQGGSPDCDPDGGQGGRLDGRSDAHASPLPTTGRELAEWLCARAASRGRPPCSSRTNPDSAVPVESASGGS